MVFKRGISGIRTHNVNLLTACAGPQLRGTGDLGLVIERATGRVTLVDTTARQPYSRIDGLGDLSHASAVYSRDGRYAFVFGRDGGLTKIDMLEGRIVKRVMQSGNAIGGSISQDGRIVVAQNYTPGGIKAFDAATLERLSEVPAEYAPGKLSKVVGLADAPGNKFAYALFEGGDIPISVFVPRSRLCSIEVLKSGPSPSAASRSTAAGSVIDSRTPVACATAVASATAADAVATIRGSS